MAPDGPIASPHDGRGPAEPQRRRDLAGRLGQWLRELRPRRHQLPADLAAGVTQAVALVPDGMASAVLARMNPIHGLHAVMFGPVLGALFCGSVFMNVSTTAALAIGAREALHGHANVTGLVTLTMLIGALQLVAGLLRLGRVTRFVSNAVMTGFLTGLGVLVILSQLGDVTGVHLQGTHRLTKLVNLVRHPERIDGATAIVAGFTIAAAVGLERTRLRMVAMVLPIAVATVAVALLGWRSVELVGRIPTGLPSAALPSLSLLWPLLTPALGLATISMVQSAGVTDNSPNPDGRYADPSRDYVGQGVANLVGGLFGILPVGSSLGGTALTISSGARSRWANVFAGLLVGVLTLAFGRLVERLPLATLGGLLLLAGARAIDKARVALVLRTGWPAALVMIFTFAATVAMPIQLAVLVGVGLSMVIQVWRAVDKVSLREIVMVDGLPEERPAPRALRSHDVTVLLPRGSMFFAGARSLEDVLPDAAGASKPIVILLLRGRKDLGSTFIRVITRYANEVRDQGGRLMLVGLDDHVLRQLRRTGALAIVGAQNVFPSTPRYGEALLLAREAALARLAR
jgi:SulP family sulfate permease